MAIIRVLLLLGFTVMATSNPVPDNCEQYHQPSFGERLLQNSDFIFGDSGVISEGRTYVTVGLWGSNDAYIILSPSQNISDDLSDDVGIPKIVIGGWNNQYSGVICNSNVDDVNDRYSTPNILNEFENRYFTISWTNNVVTVKRFGSPITIFTHQLDCPVTVRYIGTATGYSGTGVWFDMCTADFRSYRDDGNCGPDYYAPNGQPAICPGECCNNRKYCTSFPNDCDLGSWLDYEPAVPTGPPTNLNARHDADNTLVFTWEPPEIHERHAQIRRYSLYYRSSSTSDETEVSIVHYLPREHSILNPVRGAQYSYRVVAYTGVGSGPSSSVAYFTVPPLSSNDTRPYREDGRCGPGYMAPNGQQAVCPGECCSNSGYCGQEFYLHCDYDSLYKDYSGYRPAVPSGPPTDVVAQFLYDERVMLVSWNPPRVNDRNARITGYEVTYYRGRNIDPLHSAGVGLGYEIKQTEARIENLGLEDFYGIVVRALTVVGGGPRSDFAIAWTGQGEAPTTTAEPITTEPVTTPDTSDRRNFRDDLRCGRNYPAPNGEPAICPGECCNEHAYCTNDPWYCRIDYTDYSPSAPTGPPTNLNLEYDIDNTILFTWDLPEINKRNAVILGYRVYYRNTDSSSSNEEEVQSTELRVVNPASDAQYSFKVLAYTRGGNGPRSSEVMISTPAASNNADTRPYREDGKCGPGRLAPNGQQAVCPGECCSLDGLCGSGYDCYELLVYRDYRDYQPEIPTATPTNVNAVYVGDRHNIEVTWNRPDINRSNARIKGYRVRYYLSNNINNVILEDVTDTELIICEPEAGIQYAFQVLAFTHSSNGNFRDGDGPLSSKVFASVPAAPMTPEPDVADTDTRNFRDDGKCGPDFLAPNGEAAICPGECCTYSGYYCTTSYYSCQWAIDYSGPEYEPTIPSGPPVNLNAQYEVDNTILFTWDLPEAEHQNAVIKGYRYKVYYRNITTGTTSAETEVDLREYTVTEPDRRLRVLNPYPGAQYSFKVLAYTSSGDGPYSSKIFVSTPVRNVEVTDTRPYREDGKCGPGRIAPNGQQAVCPGECCSKCGVCGRAQDHCYDRLYRDYQNYHAPPPSGPPTDVSAKYLFDANSIDVTWDLPEVNKRHARIKYYDVKYYKTTEPNDVTSTQASGTELTISNPDKDSQYAIQVLAYTPSGSGPLSSKVFVSTVPPASTTPESVVPTTPQSVVTTQETDTRNYRDDFRCGPGFLAPNGEEAICPGECCTTEFWCGNQYWDCYTNVLENYQAYQPAIPTGPPIDLNIKYEADNTILFTWNPPEINKRNAALRGYRVYHRNINTSSETEVVLKSIYHELRIFNPDREAQYSFRVLAYTLAGNGPASDEVIVLIPSSSVGDMRPYREDGKCGPGNIAPSGQQAVCPGQCCSMDGLCGRSSDHCYDSLYRDYREYQPSIPTGPPTNVNAEYVVNTNTIDVTWNPPEINKRNALITGYTVTYNINDNLNDIISTTVTDLKLTISDPDSDSQYLFQVRAFTDSGDGPLSSEVSVSTPDAAVGEQVPTTPGAVFPGFQSGIEIILSEGQGVENIVDVPVIGSLKHILVNKGERISLTCKVATEGAEDVIWTHESSPISYGALFLGSGTNIQITEDLIEREWALTIDDLSESDEGQWGCAYQPAGGDLVAAVVKLTISDAEPTSQPSTSHIPESTCNNKPRRYDMTDLGMTCYFRGWADVQGQGASNDYCRVVGLSSGVQQYFSCALAGTAGESEYNFNSPNASEVWFDVGHENTWYMKDEDGDGKDDYCRCVGSPPDTYVSCMKSGDTGFIGLHDFRPPNASQNCDRTDVNPFVGSP